MLNSQVASVNTRDKQTILTIDWTDYPGVGLPLLTGLFLITSAQQLVGQQPLHVNFPFAASKTLSARVQKELPGVRLSFERPHLALSYDREALLTAPTLPVSRADPIEYRDLFKNFYPPRLVKGAEFVDQVVTDIITDGTTDPTVNAIAEHTSIPGHRLQRHISRGGLNLRKIVERIRLQMAADRLAETDTLLMDIAVEVGYSGQQALAKAFKRFHGLSPSEYRQLVARTLVMRSNVSRRNSQ